jgi:predicted  nucleic acid-binding Zn-ribbon protein
MRTLEQLKERKNELEDELSQFMWWGNEDDEDYKEEYGREYEHLQTELDDIREQIWRYNNQFPIGMKQSSSKEALNHLFNKNK